MAAQGFQRHDTLDDRDVTKSSVEFTARSRASTPASRHATIICEQRILRGGQTPGDHLQEHPSRTQGKTATSSRRLTLKGVTKQVALPFTITGALRTRGGTRASASTRTEDRPPRLRDHLGKALEGADSTRHEVTIALAIEAVSPPPSPLLSSGSDGARGVEPRRALC